MLATQKPSEKLWSNLTSLPRQGHHATGILYNKWLKTARDSQYTPPQEIYGDWQIWLILAGRGWGKTMTGAMDVLFYALRNPEVQVAVVTPTFGDIRRVAFGGVSGILKYLPKECMLGGSGRGYNATASEINLYNGSKIMGFSATEPDRLRGPQFHRAWCDELAAWQYPDTFDQLMFGLRLGENPQCVITTTPKPTSIIRNLLKRTGGVVVTRGSTFENEANLAPAAIQQLKEKYEGTRLGRQELYAEVLDDIEGALWTYAMIEGSRISDQNLPEFQRIVVALDPAVTSGDDSDETGIIVAARGENNKFYVLEDATMKASPDGWARKAVELYHKYNADRIIAEVNNGGDLVERVVRTIETVPYSAVRASRGKLVRAEPIAALYEQRKVHHVKEFKELEDQLISYTPTSRSSPDRLDALVWALTELSQRSGKPSWRIS
jgi:predicted phage terminase large subunit-like protein